MARCPLHQARSRCALSSYDAGQDRALAPDPQKPHPVGELLLARRPRSPDRRLRRRLQPLPLPREHRQSHPGGRVLRTRSSHPGRTRKDQTSDYRQSPPAAPVAGSLKYQSDAPEPPLLYPARCLKNPDDGQVRLKASLLGHLERMEEAEEWIQRTLELYPGLTVAYLERYLNPLIAATPLQLEGLRKAGLPNN